MSEIRVTNILGENGNSPVNFTKGINMSGICTAPAFVPSQGQLSHRNIIVNGAMTVAQRSASSTDNGYGSVDRFQSSYSATDENPTQTQHTLTSSDTGPYAEGFRKSFHVQNGNQTSGAGSSDFIRLWHKIEAQDLANSGWNYTSSSSYITLSFWVKASVTQTYYVQMRTSDGTSKSYYFAMNLSANTWTKVTHSIPGHADISFDNDNGEGIYIAWYTFRGTNNTGSGQDANQWNNWDGSYITPDQTTTWYTTNDSTFEITGVQLEVGSVATPFEHRRYGEELRRCERYYQKKDNYPNQPYGVGNIDGANQGQLHVTLITSMRQKPTLETTGTASDYGLRVRSTQTCTGVPTLPSLTASTDSVFLEIPRASHGFTDGQACFCVAMNSSSFLAFNAEL